MVGKRSREAEAANTRGASFSVLQGISKAKGSFLSLTLQGPCGMSLWLHGCFSAGDRFPPLSLISPALLSVALDAGRKAKKSSSIKQ